MPPPCQSCRLFPARVTCVYRSEVWEATGIFLVFSRDEENRLVKFVVAELLKGDSRCDRGEDGDVCKAVKQNNTMSFFPSLLLKLTHSQECSGRSIRTEFDWKPRGKFHLNKLSEFVEVLERGDDFQHI